MHFASGLPIVVAGLLGSLMVISVNGWMNHPAGFRLVGGKASGSWCWRTPGAHAVGASALLVSAALAARVLISADVLGD